jgi:hypothetical protein
MNAEFLERLNRRVLESTCGSTSNIVDQYRRLAALAYGRQQNCEDLAKSVILESRLYWLNWLSVTQRQWQTSVSRRSKALHIHHHKPQDRDSINARNKYVRCL